MERARLHRFLDDIEACAEQAGPAMRASVPKETLGRLYTVYAEKALREHGIRIDMQRVCGDGG